MLYFQFSCILSLLIQSSDEVVIEERPSDDSSTPAQRGRQQQRQRHASASNNMESRQPQDKLVINLEVNRYAFKVALWFIYTDQIYPYIKG